MTEKYSDPRFAAVAENYRVIADRVANAAIRSGRNPEDVILMAATKTVPVEVINHAIDCGLRYIGENRVQEFMDKYEKIQWSAGVTGHIIGRLQTNKVKYIGDGALSLNEGEIVYEGTKQEFISKFLGKSKCFLRSHNQQTITCFDGEIVIEK